MSVIRIVQVQNIFDSICTLKIWGQNGEKVCNYDEPKRGELHRDSRGISRF